MRLLRSRVLLLLLLATNLSLAEEDFDPRGRRPVQHGRIPTATHHVTPAEGAERALRAALAEPGAPFPFDRLTRAFREKDANLDALTKLLEGRIAAGGEPLAPLHATLAGVYNVTGRKQEARALFERAADENPKSESIALGLAALVLGAGDLAAAKGRFEQLLALQTNAFAKQDTRRTLRGICLDLGDTGAARRVQADIVHASPSNVEAAAELARELVIRGKLDDAEAEFSIAVGVAKGSPHSLAALLRELGLVQWKRHNADAARATLRHALELAAGNENLKTSVLRTLAEVYRAEHRTEELITLLDASTGRDTGRLILQGELYEETGDPERAAAAYRRALSLAPGDVDARLRLIHLLEAKGESEGALREYETLVRVSRRASYAFDLANTLFGRGEREKALHVLGEIERTHAGEEDVLSKLALVYKRAGDESRAERVLVALAERGGADGAYLVDLGDHYFSRGQKELAKKTWARILGVVRPAAHAYAVLGDVYLEHELVPDALTALATAVEKAPTNGRIRYAYGSALLRAERRADAGSALAEALRLSISAGDQPLARQVRAQIVTLWEKGRELDLRARALNILFRHEPPDLDAGRTLVEVQIRLGHRTDAEATLQHLIDLAPGDAEAHLALERVFVSQGKFKEAIQILAHLAEADPQRAPKLYERMSQYAKQTFQEADALKYSARAVEVAPNDAEAHRRLGLAYAARGESDLAIGEYRKALAKDDHLFPVYFELADALSLRGGSAEAESLLLTVVRTATEEAMIRSAASAVLRSSSKDSLEKLERELVPLALTNASRSVYRHLLLEVYEVSTAESRLLAQGEGATAEEARRALTRVADRGQKVLLDALSDKVGREALLALELLGWSTHRAAAEPLFTFATGDADITLRARVLAVCGKLADPALLPKLSELVLPRPPSDARPYPGDAIIDAAIWAIARLSDPRAVALLERVAGDAPAFSRAAALLALGAKGERRAVTLARDALRPGAPNSLMRAAAVTLTALGDGEAAPRILELLPEVDVGTKAVMLASLAELPVRDEADRRSAEQLFSEALLSPQQLPGRSSTESDLSAPFQKLAAVGLTALLADEVEVNPPAGLGLEATTRAVLDSFVARVAGRRRSPEALSRFHEVVAGTLERALRDGGERRDVSLSLLDNDAELLLRVFAIDGTPPNARRAQLLTTSVIAALVSLAQSKEATSAAVAAHVLATNEEPKAATWVRRELLEKGSPNRLAVLRAISFWPPDSDLEPFASLLSQTEAWPVRVAAIEALGRIGSRHPGAFALLSKVAENDPSPLVRRTALVSASLIGEDAARAVAAKLVNTDTEPRIRDAATEILRHN